MASIYSSLVVLLATALCGAWAITAGFQSRITQRALDYAGRRAIDALAAKVPAAKIPDQSSRSGDIEYQLNSIRITGFNKPSSQIQVVPNTGLSWTANGISVDLESKWRVKTRGWIKMSMSGRVEASVTDISFKVTMAFGSDSTGRISVKSDGCQAHVGHVHINIHGDLDFVLNLFTGAVEDNVKSQIPAKLCDALNDQVNRGGNQALQKMKVTSYLAGKLFKLDYRLVAPPSFVTDYMQTFHKGEITWTTDPHPPPFPPSNFSISSSSSSMMYLWVGEYLPQSFAYAAQNHGFLQYNLTTKDLDPDQRGFLNTTCTVGTCVGRMIPAAAKKYPGLTTELRMNSTSVPIVMMSLNRLETQFTGDIAVYVNTPAGPPVYLLTVGVSATFNMTATVNKGLLVGNITNSRFKVNVVDSAVGPVKSKVINVMVGLAMKFFIIPTMNEQGNRGVPLIKGADQLQFVNTKLQFQQNALLVATDVVYNF